MRSHVLSIPIALLTSCCGGGTSTSRAPTPTVVASPAVAPAPTADGAPVPQWIWGGAQFFEDATFVNDDTLVVVAEGGASAIDVATGQVRAFLPESGVWGRHLRPSRDGHAVLDGAGEWSLDDGSALQLPGTLLDTLDASPIMDSYVLAGARRVVVTTRTDQTLADAEGRIVVAGLVTNALASTALDPTGRTILVLGSHAEIRDAADGSVRATVEGRWFSAAYTDDGARVLLARDHALQVIDAATGQTLAQAEGLGSVLGVAPGAGWALFHSGDRVQLFDGTTLGVAGEGSYPAMQRFPPLISAGGAFVSDGPGERVVHDLRAGTHVALSTSIATPLAMDAHATRVLVRTDDAMVLLDPSAPEPVWSVPQRQTVRIDGVTVLLEQVVVSSDAGTWVLGADGSTHHWECRDGYPRPQSADVITLLCADGSVIDATTGEVRTPAGGTVDPCVFVSDPSAARECELDELDAISNAYRHLTVEVGNIARVTHGADAISFGLYETPSEVALAVWDERGRGTDSGGLLRVRDAGPIREAAVRAPARAELVRELLASIEE